MKNISKQKKGTTNKENSNLFRTVSSLIEKSRQRAAVFINSELILLYWNVGSHIRENILQNRRAGYGEQTIASLSKRLTEI